MIDFYRRLVLHILALLITGELITSCSFPLLGSINYPGNKAKQATLLLPPNILEEPSDYRSLPQNSIATRLQLDQMRKVVSTSS